MIAKTSTLILAMSLFSLFRIAAAEEPKLKKVSYRGGVVEFSIQANWREEEGTDGGGMYYGPSTNAGILRLNVVTAKSPKPITAASEGLKVLKVAQSHQIDSLPNGNALLHYSEPTTESGEKLHMVYWFLANAVDTNHVRVAIFTYTLREGQQNQASFANEIAIIDSEVRRATFAKKLGYTEPSK